MNTAVVIPNMNGKDSLKSCLDSVRAQTEPCTIVVVENGSTDGSLEYLREHYPDVELVVNDHNRGFAGGVNDGIKKAKELGCEFVALLNNDAVADVAWLKRLVGCLQDYPEFGIATPKIVSRDGGHLDSTGEGYSVWGLPFPRGRDEAVSGAYDDKTIVFGASGGASLYRMKMFDEIGLFDEDFFAYYEDVDVSFRAQLAAWQVCYVPQAVVRHEIGSTSARMRSGFITHQTTKNLPLLFIKNVPRRFLFRVGWRLLLADSLFIAKAFTRGHGWAALSGDWRATMLLPKKLMERRRIQHDKKVSDEYIWAMISHDLPPNAARLRRMRAGYRKLIRKSQTR